MRDFGPAWSGAAVLIALCALFALFDAAVHFTFNIFAVIDRLPRLVCTYALAVAIRLPCVIVGVLYAGAVGGVAALLATALLNVVIFYGQMLRILAMPASRLLVHVVRPLAAAAFMAALVCSLRLVLPTSGAGIGENVARLLQLVASGALAYTLVLFALWRIAGRPDGAERRLISVLEGFLRRLSGRRAASGASGAGR